MVSLEKFKLNILNKLLKMAIYNLDLVFDINNINAYDIT